MLDDVTELAASKTRMGDESSLANKMTFQRNYSHHEGMWRAAYHLVIQTYNAIESQFLNSKQPRCEPNCGLQLPMPPKRLEKSPSGRILPLAPRPFAKAVD